MNSAHKGTDVVIFVIHTYTYLHSTTLQIMFLMSDRSVLIYILCTYFDKHLYFRPCIWERLEINQEIDNAELSRIWSRTQVFWRNCENRAVPLDCCVWGEKRSTVWLQRDDGVFGGKRHLYGRLWWKVIMSWHGTALITGPLYGKSTGDSTHKAPALREIVIFFFVSLNEQSIWRGFETS